MKVYVYRNLHKKCYSIMDTRGKVIGHADTVYLKDASFVVRAGGYERYLREGSKNVHAFVKGTLEPGPSGVSTGTPISYNPAKGPRFTHGPYQVVRASYVHMDTVGENKRPVIGASYVEYKYDEAQMEVF